jgi:hypothetical protein
VNTPTEYRDCAAECLRAMQLAMSPEVKAMLLQMAQRWTELADRLEASMSRGPLDAGDVRESAVLPPERTGRDYR